MRILAMTNLYPNPFQPHRATFNRDTLRTLAGLHEVRVISPIAWTDEWVARRRSAAPLPRVRQLEFDGISIAYPRFWFPPRVLRRWHGQFYHWSVRRVFEQIVADFRPDLIFAPWAYPDGWAAVQLGRRAGLPVVIKVHGSDIRLLDQHPAKKSGTADAVRDADRIVAVSQDLADRVIALGADPERVAVVYDGTDLNQFHPGPREAARNRLGLSLDEPVILFVGNLIALKGVLVLSEACTKLAASGYRFRCHLIGQGALRTRLEQQIQTLGLTDRMQLHGALAHDHLPEWYRAANVFVLPSYSEGVPIVLLEAAACGTPFVASRVGGIPEIAHMGLSRLVPAGNAVALAEAIAAFLTVPQPLVANGLPAVRSQAESVQQLSRLLEETAQKTGRRIHSHALPMGVC